ncbi:MAG: hypothetical protein A3G59_03065 [Candidatus Taylorbacteria bacterium RIFCSPLOWO2_12_FULL_47_20]|uniref:Penicillin-binding protein transpeptidase domain-containing protein n=2 Tax=Candidatus Tayloriibacteriota TaxID=1817919 RepID=A0A1G2PA16_9BACT|nr:MAG: hypothetical protein A3H68_01340 [Candidatus Taylorbacteria bacterium RIFCSPLOWO2_02_FULL_46_40]OHA45187.1 MAG: hypothetical protein A3G59_03065 [Candidatus Taylorbacteria bacterium RIFCSPLOWO2_12_FULL_47_20]
MSKSAARSRIRLLYFFSAVVAVVLLGRLYFVQLVHGEMYLDLADRRHVSKSSLFDRGSIYFETKEAETVSAASVANGFLLFINPSKISDPGNVFSRLQKLLPELNKEQFMSSASREGDIYEEIFHKIISETALAIEDLAIEGVGVAKERWRYYPGERLASNVLGIVAFNGDSLGGRYGVESYYDDLLSRDSGIAYMSFVKDLFSGIQTASKGELGNKGDITLTIEPSVQSYLEGILSEVSDKYKSEQTGAIVMDPFTGEILAMAVTPTFNPNNLDTESSSAIFSNPIVESVYEMGSIFKPITMAIGLDTKAVRADTKYDDKGALTIDGRTISNFDGRARGVVSMQEVLNQSLNTGAVYVAEAVGKKNYNEYLLKFGLAEETGVDLPGEAQGLLQNALNSNRKIEMATAAYGQGIAFSPIAIVRALSALGNGGTLPDPHVVKEIKFENGLKSKMETKDTGQKVIKKETSEEVTRMLVRVVDEALAHGTIKMERYSVAAKTGTAQIAKPSGGGYYDDRYLHSFFGYFPAFNPRFIVFLYTVYPKGVSYASETLTTPFAEMTQYLINYYEIPPDR